MIDLLRELTVFQWVVIGGGVLLIFPIIKDFFQDDSPKPKNSLPSYPISNVEDINALTSIVYKWEILYNACSEKGLTNAQNKLEEVFPMFAKLRDYKPEPPKENGSDNG
tara:strand:+ start:21 stop:347 length:327 start_codon:yes stop_codon:yes gene_type:complete